MVELEVINKTDRGEQKVETDQMVKLKADNVKENFRRCIVDILSNGTDVMMTNVDEWWEETARQIRKCGEEICGRSSGKKKPVLGSWWRNEETEKAVK